MLQYPAGYGRQLGSPGAPRLGQPSQTWLTPLSLRGRGRNRGRVTLGWRPNDPLTGKLQGFPERRRRLITESLTGPALRGHGGVHPFAATPLHPGRGGL